MSCDHNAQCVLQQAETEGLHDLDGSDSDPTRQKLVSSISDLIAKDTPSEKVRTELDCLENIYNCKRKHGESLASFVLRFKGCVARFTIRAPTIDEGSGRHFGMFLIRNAKLSPGTLNCVTFQISSNIDAVTYSSHKGAILKSDAERIWTESISYNNIDCLDSKNQINEAVDRLQKCVTTASNDSRYYFGLEHVAKIVAQLKSEDTLPMGNDTVYCRRTSMLGFRLNEDTDGKLRYLKKIKSQSACMACGNVDHWYRNLKECQDKMRAKKRAHTAANTRGPCTRN